LGRARRVCEVGDEHVCELVPQLPVPVLLDVEEGLQVVFWSFLSCLLQELGDLLGVDCHDEGGVTTSSRASVFAVRERR